MNRADLYLKDLDALRNAEFGERVDDFMLERHVRRDMYVGKSASIQEIVGQPGAFTQDAVRAFIIRQGGRIERS